MRGTIISRTVASLSVLIGLVAGPALAAVDIETVPVGDPGNAADTPEHSGNPAGQGSVSYTYKIGKYEITGAQYCEFLNKMAATDTYGLYDPGMWDSYFRSRISRSGAPGSYTYTLDPAFVNRPASCMSYWRACRFANWLHNGQPTGAQGPGTTETGAYTLNGYNGTDGRTIQRNPGARWAVPSEDEWYKAAYYKGGSSSAGYWNYATSSDTYPGQDMADASGNNATYRTFANQSPIDPPYYTTVVGQFRNSAGPYGTFDQCGNVDEYNESIIYGSPPEWALRSLRGGSYSIDCEGANTLVASYREMHYSPSYGSISAGLRLVIPPVGVASVTATNPDGLYGAGSVIGIQVVFSGVVNVTGAPQLTLATNPTGVASYSSGSGSDRLLFNYSVRAGDTAADLDYLSTSALSANGGTITELSGQSVNLTLPAPGTFDSLSENKNIGIDTTPPRVANVTATNANGTYGIGSIIRVQVVFGVVVNVTGTPQLALATNPSAVASYSSGSGSNTLLFNYTVRAGDTAADLDYLSTSAVSLNGGTIADPCGQSAVLTLPAPGATGSLSYNKNIAISGNPPRVASVTATNESGVYGIGSVIGVQIVFDRPVMVTGTPRLTMGATPLRVVDYASGSGTNTLLFNYTVQPGDTAADLDYASSTALNPAGGLIQDAIGNNAVLLLPPPGTASSLSVNKDIAIDGVAPVVTNVTAVEPDGVYGLGSTIHVQVIFSEPVIVTGTPQLMVNAGRTAGYSSGSGSATVQFEYTVQAGDVVERLDYTAASALALNGGTIRDAASNDANLTLPAPGTPGSLGDNRNIVIDTAGPEAVEWYSARDHGGDAVLLPLSGSPGLDGSTVEPRLGGLQRIYVGFTHGIEIINPAGFVVTGHTTAGGLLQGATDYSGSATLSVPDPYFLQIDFPSPPNPAALPDQTCYTIAIAGAVRGANGVALTGTSTIHVRVLGGDTTGNGQVNLGDALMIRSGINTRSIWDAPGLDLNCDGVIDNADMLLCKQKVASPPAAAQCP